MIKSFLKLENIFIIGGILINLYGMDSDYGSGQFFC